MKRLFQRDKRNKIAPDFPVTRSLLTGLLTVYVCVIWLHLSTIPLWLLGISCLVAVWRINVLRERWPPPGLLVKAGAIALSAGLLRLEYQQWLTIEPMIALLLVALSLKLLEIRYRRDFLLVLLLSYFAIACSFLFERDVLHSITALLAVIATTAVLAQLYTVGHSHLLRHIRLAGVMLLQSTALMLVMLLVLPRLNPLWYVPLHSGNGVTGMSDSMSPGDFDQLIRSNDLAMRVTFSADSDSESINRADMYWRGLVFERFDGRRWQRREPVETTVNRQKSRPGIYRQPSGVPLAQYDVLMEASGQYWLFVFPPQRLMPRQVMGQAHSSTRHSKKFFAGNRCNNVLNTTLAFIAKSSQLNKKHWPNKTELILPAYLTE